MGMPPPTSPTATAPPTAPHQGVANRAFEVALSVECAEMPRMASLTAISKWRVGRVRGNAPYGVANRDLEVGVSVECAEMPRMAWLTAISS